MRQIPKMTATLNLYEVHILYTDGLKSCKYLSYGFYRVCYVASAIYHLDRTFFETR